MTEPRHETGGRWIALMVFCALFFGIPILFSWYASRTDLEHLERREILKARSRIEFAAMSLDAMVKNKEYFTTLLRNILLRQVLENRDWKWLEAELRRFGNEFPEVFRFVGLDRRGNAIPGLQDKAIPKDLASRFVQDYLSVWKGNQAPLMAHLPLYRRFLGPMAGKARIGDIVNRLDHSTGHPDQRYVYVSPPLTDGLLIAYFHESPSWDALNFRRQIPERLQGFPQVGYRLCRLDHPERVLVDRLGKSLSQHLDPVLIALGTSDRTKVEIGCASWMRVRLSPEYQVILAASVPAKQRRDLSLRHRHLDATALAQFLVCSLLAVIMARWIPALLNSIRWQALLLLLFVVLVSLGLLRISAQGYLLELKRNLVRQTFADLQEQVNELDNGFPAFLRSLKSTLASRLQFTTDNSEDLIRQTSFRLGSLALEMGAGDYEVFDPQGKFCLHAPSLPTDAPTPNQPMRKIFAMSKHSFARVIQVLNGEGEAIVSRGKGPILEMGGDLLGINFDLMISQVMRDIGGVISVEFGNSSMKGAFLPIRDRTGKVRFLGYLGWNSPHLYRYYLETRIAGHDAGNARHKIPIRLLAYQSDRKYRVPAKSRYAAIFSNTSHFLGRTGEVLRAHLRPDRQGDLLVGLAARFLPGYTLFAVVPERLVETHCSEVRFRFLGIGFGILILSLIAGNALFRSFWAPVTDLEQGVSAINERRFGERIPVRSHDEFGILARHFNELLESLTDLEIAETLQRTIFPQSSLVQNNWEIKGRCVPSSKVGGDFFDYFPLPDGRLGFILGDVSGHGAGAALVVGMAKAFFTHPERVFDPVTCLASLSSLILTTLKQKKMMTCLVGSFDPATRHLKIANAGQTYPLIVSPDSIEHIRLPGFPLGFKNKRGYPVHERILNPDQAMILYTDYLVEAEIGHNQQIGFTELERALPGLLSIDAAVTEQRIREWHGARVLPGPAKDDLTIVVLVRRQDQGIN